MARSQALGIERLEDVLFYVHDLERSTRFYLDKLDFALTARSSEALEAASGERTRVFEAGRIRVTVVAPTRPTSDSARYLKRHPDGIATLIFAVKDVRETFRVLDERGATIVDDITWVEQRLAGDADAVGGARDDHDVIHREVEVLDLGRALREGLAQGTWAERPVVFERFLLIVVDHPAGCVEQDVSR